MLITPEELALHSLSVDESYVPGDLDYGASAVHQTGRLTLHALAELSGGEIRIRGQLSTVLGMECDRCASPIEFPLHRSFDLYYRPLSSIARVEEIEIPKDELEVGFYPAEGVDLREVAKEQVLLALPMKRLCHTDCRGLCARCGANLNVEPCQCSLHPTDSPFAFLADRQDR
jgi:uncharacterized protein